VPGAVKRRSWGQHFLVPSVAADLVRQASIHPGELVLEIGTGTGVLTSELAGTGARVVTFEIDHRLARRAANRLSSFDNVRVIAADFLSAPLPRRPFRVVANLPFAGSTPILRRLLDGRVPLTRADLLVAWGAALGWTAESPPRPYVKCWSRWYDVRIEGRIPARAFRPPPSTDAALLTARRRGRRRARNSDFTVPSRR
jgi:23S rRNA (adenine-N6)-dimethyltransferase